MMRFRAHVRYFFIAFIIALLGVLYVYSFDAEKSLRIGYFHGGRTMLLYRAYIKGQLPSNILLVTKNLSSETYAEVSHHFEDSIVSDFGKVRGGELIDEIINGNLDGATVGESSFIKAALQGKPIVAVAQLGHDSKNNPAHALVFRNGIHIRTPDDVRGLKLVSRRAGDGDETFLREWVMNIGLDPDRDVTIVPQVSDDEWIRGIGDGTFDGGYYHEMAIEKIVGEGKGYVYQLLDWVNPELSHALLVFHRDVVKKYPEDISKLIAAYSKRITYEQSLSQRERMFQGSQVLPIGLRMEADFHGLNLPQYSNPPVVSLPLLTEMCVLLRKHHKVSGACDLSQMIDNSLVNTALAK